MSAVRRESTEWAEATLILGGEARRKVGEGEVGWLRMACGPDRHVNTDQCNGCESDQRTRNPI